jgi:hypothetical protein
MRKKWLLWPGALVLFCLSPAGAKTYDVNFTAPEKVGSVQLPQGEYKLKVEGSEAIFTSARNGESFSTAATLENADKKFETTAIDSVKDEHGDRVTAIEIQGTRIKLRFN